MISEISRALNSIVGNVPALKNANGAGRIYELYLMTAIADELRASGANVWVQRSDGSRIRKSDRVRDFIQRGGPPSGLPGVSQGSGGISTIAFRLQASSRIWEIWNGVQFSGRSGASHEFDIAIVPSYTGTGLRSQPRGGIPFGRPRVAIECKDVSAAGSMDEVRAFVARLYDVTILTSHAPYLISRCNPLTSIHPGQLPSDKPYTTFFESNSACYSMIARRAAFSKGVLPLTSYYHIDPRQNIELCSLDLNRLVKDLSVWINANLI